MPLSSFRFLPRLAPVERGHDHRGVRRDSGRILLYSMVRGDGSLHFVERVEDLESAKARVEGFTKLWPGTYVIVNQETGERLSISTGDEKIH